MPGLFKIGSMKRKYSAVINHAWLFDLLYAVIQGYKLHFNFFPFIIHERIMPQTQEQYLASQHGSTEYCIYLQSQNYITCKGNQQKAPGIEL